MSTWETRMIETARGVFEVFVRGEGAPICVTHHYSEFNESGDYLANVFTRHHQVFLVNLRETGRSAKAAEESQLSMAETVEDLEAIREALGFATWSFAGLSTGGMLGVAYGVYRSSSLDALIVVGAAASKDYYSTPDCIYNTEHPQYARGQELIVQLKSPNLSPEERKQLSIERTKLSLYKPERYEQYFSQGIQKGMSAKRLDYFSWKDDFELKDQLSAITAKTLIICGRHDVQCPLRCSIEMSKGIPHAKLVVFEESNHYPFLEEAERFSEVVEEFLCGGRSD